MHFSGNGNLIQIATSDGFVKVLEPDTNQIILS
jgi:hypothetical protein